MERRRHRLRESTWKGKCSCVCVRVSVCVWCLYRLNAKIAISKHAKIRFGEFAHISYPSTSDSINVSIHTKTKTLIANIYHFTLPLQFRQV